jgi:acyl carrier protein
LIEITTYLFNEENRLDTFETLREIIVEEFGKPISGVTHDATFKSLGIDSLNIFEVVFYAEEKFNIKVPSEAINIKTIQDAVILLDRLRAEQKTV